MKVSVLEVKEVMRKALRSKNYTDEDIDFIIEVYLGGELRGHVTHGLAPFPAFAREDFSDCPDPFVVRETHSLYMVDAQGNSGFVVGRHAADEAIKRAREEIIAFSIVRNMGDWIRPGALAKYVAEHDMIAIVSNDGSGRAIAPPGGYDPTVGTNPLAYGIPTKDEPLVVEMATSKRAWGQVRLAKKYGHDVPENTFYTDKGTVAKDPEDVHSVMPFGEHKGFALGLLVEIMCGSMIGHEMMRVSDASSFDKTWPANSGFILVIDPSQTNDLELFKSDTTAAIDWIKSTHALPGEEIRIPGESAGKKQAQALKDGVVEISEELWNELKGL